MAAGRRVWTRVLVWGLVVLIVAAIGFALRPQPVPVDVVRVSRGPLQVTIDEEGETRVRHRFVVSAPLTGRVLRVTLEPGDAVRAGESVVATFLPAAPALLDARTRAELEARVKAAAAAVERVRVERDRARTELGFAATDAKRYRELAAAGLVSDERRESAELTARTREEALRAAEFAVASAEYDLEVAKASLLQIQSPGGLDGAAPMVLRSPIDGVVLRRLRESEAVVAAGEPIVEVGNLADLEIVSDMLSTDAVRIQSGQPVLIERWGGDTALQGRVRRVEPFGFTKISALGVEEQRVNVLIDFVDVHAAAQSLGDGYRVEVRVIVWEADEVVKVPTSSLFRDEDRWSVFVVEAGRATRRDVEIGQRTGLEAQILSGLDEGERLIVFPGDAVADGVAVEPRS